MKKRVVITGMGVVCSGAKGKEEFTKACFQGESKIRECTVFDASKLLTSKFGQADIEEDGRFLHLLRESAEEMMADAGLAKYDLEKMGARCRLFLGSLLYSSDIYYQHSLNKSRKLEDDLLVHMNDYTAYVREITGVKGMASVSSAACASGTTAVGMAFDYIRQGICECAVAGGADALSVIAAYGFHALKSLSQGICNPYDENRDGINIGECGAFFMVESLEHAISRNAHIYCEIKGYALGNDAYHITSPQPNGEGAYQVMKKALEDGGLAPSELDYINGHGTGTRINDSMEVKAIERLLMDSGKKAAVSSTKGLIGHCMGAAGAVELASVILAMQKGKYIPMPGLQKPMEEARNLCLSSETFDLDIQYALSNNFAFAGNSASILIKKTEGGA